MRAIGGEVAVGVVGEGDAVDAGVLIQSIGNVIAALVGAVHQPIVVLLVVRARN